MKWGPHGWLYGRCGGSCPGRIGTPGTPDDRRVALEGGIWRFHPRTFQFEGLAHGITNPWGHDWNEWSDGFFINTVNGRLWHLIPGAHFVRPFTLDPNPHVYELIDMHADHWERQRKDMQFPHFRGEWSKKFSLIPEAWCYLRETLGRKVLSANHLRRECMWPEHHASGMSENFSTQMVVQ